MTAGNFVQTQFTIIFTKIIRQMVSILIIVGSFFICKLGVKYLDLEELPEIETAGPYLVLFLIGYLTTKAFLMNFDIVATTLLHCSAQENDQK